jgi:hypothetical protein
MRLEQFGTPIDGIPIHGLARMQVCGHTSVLASLSAEEKSDRAVASFMQSRDDRRPLRLSE